MKLDNDLVRDVMLFIEDKCEITKPLTGTMIQIPERTEDEIVYTLLKLDEAGFIKCSKQFYDNQTFVLVNSLTWDGHQFLDNIRDETVWNKTKQLASNFSSASISILSKIAVEVLSKMISGNI